MKLQVVIHPAEECGFWAEIPALAGCVSEGETLEETLQTGLQNPSGLRLVRAVRERIMRYVF